MPDTETNDLVQVSGIVRLVGNMPFPQLVISDSEGDWYINAEEAHKLRDFQHRRIVAEGLQETITITFASGISGGERRILRDIRIISIE